MGGLHYISASTPPAPTDLSACDCIQPNQHVAWPNRALPKATGRSSSLAVAAAGLAAICKYYVNEVYTMKLHVYGGLTFTLKPLQLFKCVLHP